MVNINKYITALLHPAGGHQAREAIRLIKLATIHSFTQTWVRFICYT